MDYIIIDDFVESGDTINEIVIAVTRLFCRFTRYTQSGERIDLIPNLKKIYLYESGGAKTESVKSMFGVEVQRVIPELPIFQMKESSKKEIKKLVSDIRKSK